MPVYYRLAEKARRLILKESSHECPNETGGMLVGRFGGNRVLIEHATRPGPRAQRLSHRFKRDGDYSQQVLDRIVAESKGERDYIGEWHSHPAQSGPSAQDVAAMSWIANNSRYAIDRPILVLCTCKSVDTWQLSFYLFDGQRLRKLKQSRGGAS